MIQRLNSLQVSSGLSHPDQTITVREILRTYCLASNANSIISINIKDRVKRDLGLTDIESDGTFSLNYPSDKLTEFQKLLLERLNPLATNFSILWSSSYSPVIDSFKILDLKINNAFEDEIKNRSFYGIDDCNERQLNKYRKEFEEFLVVAFFPQMLINEVPVIDQIVKNFVEIAKIVTGDFVDQEDGFWSEFKSRNDLYKICSIPAYINLRNKQMLLAGVPESDLIASGETVLKMQNQIDKQCKSLLNQECRKLLSIFYNDEISEKRVNKINEGKRRLK